MMLTGLWWRAALTLAVLGSLLSVLAVGAGQAEPGRDFVAFSYNGTSGSEDIFLLDVSQRLVAHLIDHPQADYTPVISPDGWQMAFASNRNSISEIYLYDLAGGHLRSLTPPGINDYTPAWSPDGAQIAFMSRHDDERSSTVYIMNNDGTERRELWNGFWPTWSPDGTKLAFISERADGTASLHTIKPDGSAVRRLTHTINAYMPTWSPDGARIAFLCRGSSVICLIDPNGGNLFDLTADYDIIGTLPRWMPNNEQLIFEVDNASIRNGIYVIHADGSNLRRLTIPNFTDTKPRWMP